MSGSRQIAERMNPGKVADRSSAVLRGLVIAIHDRPAVNLDMLSGNPCMFDSNTSTSPSRDPASHSRDRL